MNVRRECYSLQPPRIELYTVFSGTDIILRKNITETEKEETKALKNSDVSAGTSDMENEQKEENNNQETTSSNLMN